MKPRERWFSEHTGWPLDAKRSASYEPVAREQRLRWMKGGEGGKGSQLVGERRASELAVVLTTSVILLSSCLARSTSHLQSAFSSPVPPPSSRKNTLPFPPPVPYFSYTPQRRTPTKACSLFTPFISVLTFRCWPKRRCLSSSICRGGGKFERELCQDLAA